MRIKSLFRSTSSIKKKLEVEYVIMCTLSIIKYLKLETHLYIERVSVWREGINGVTRAMM